MSETGINDANGIDCSDLIDSVIAIMDTEHHHVHDGIAFRAAKLYSVTTGATVNLEIKTGSKTVHLKQNGIINDVNVVVATLIEQPVITDGTTAVPILNANRNNATASTVKIFSDPSGMSGGTTLDSDLVSAAKTNALLSSAIEWLLKPNTTYVLSMTNQGATTSQVLARFFWYEM